MTAEESQANNPLLAELPRWDSRKAFVEGLQHRPALPGDMRAVDPSVRLAATNELLSCYFPTVDQVRFAEDFDAILRTGYARRSVANRDGRIAKLSVDLKRAIDGDPNLVDLVWDSDASSLNATLLGVPQMGKSLTVNRVLKRYPQRVRHIGMSDQVVWLKVGCPADGSLKGFCLAFFDELDRALGQSAYKLTFGAQNAGLEEMPGHVLRLANIHSLGVLVIDDIHFLGPPTDEDHAVLKLLLACSSVAGVPCVRIGTLAAAGIVQASAQLAFRSVGAASDHWMPIPAGAHWQAFLSQLWRYQWTRQKTELTPELSALFHDRTQGVISLAVQLFWRVQRELIRRNLNSTGAHQPEVITAQFVDDVDQRFFVSCHAHIDALRSGDARRLWQFPDLRPPELQTPGVRARRKKADEATEEAQSKAEPSDGANGAGTKTEAEILGEHIEQAAVAMMLQAGMDGEYIKAKIAGFKSDFPEGIANDARKFYKAVEKLIRSHLNSRLKPNAKNGSRKADGAGQAGGDGQPGDPNDLRTILDGSSSVLELLKAAKIEGPASVFGRR